MGAVAKVSVAMQKQILELHAQGMTARKIAKVLKVGRNTIRKVINRNTISEPGASVPSWAKSVDWEKIRLEVAGRVLTLVEIHLAKKGEFSKMGNSELTIFKQRRIPNASETERAREAQAT